MVDPEGYSAVTTRTFANSGPAGSNCVAGIRRSWGIMESLGATRQGREKLTEALGLCAAPDSHAAVKADVFAFISAAWQYMAMADYPYPASFLGPMPAWPVKAACASFADVGPSAPDDAVLGAVRAGFNVFYNYTGQAGACFNVSAAGPSTLGAPTAWNFQACTEVCLWGGGRPKEDPRLAPARPPRRPRALLPQMLLPVAQSGTEDMFYPQPWNLTEVVAQCKSQFGVRSRPRWAITTYGGERLDGASNIVYSNGNLDPWSAGGVQTNVSTARDVVAVVIDQGAHHLDLRAPNSADPESVKHARRLEASYIAKWIEQWNDGTGHHHRRSSQVA